MTNLQSVFLAVIAIVVTLHAIVTLLAWRGMTLNLQLEIVDSTVHFDDDDDGLDDDDDDDLIDEDPEVDLCAACSAELNEGGVHTTA